MQRSISHGSPEETTFQEQNEKKTNTLQTGETHALPLFSV
jgi:hypothetical protein